MNYAFGSNKSSILKTGKAYNDNEWHFVELSQTGQRGKLVIDGVDAVSVSGDHDSIAFKAPVFIGGVRPQDYNIITANVVSINLFSISPITSENHAMSAASNTPAILLVDTTPLLMRPCRFYIRTFAQKYNAVFCRFFRTLRNRSRAACAT